MKTVNPRLLLSFPNRLACVTTLALLAHAASPSAHAAVIITTSGGNNHQLTSVTVNGDTYTNWIGITVTGISAFNVGNDSFFQIPDGATQSAAADRMDLLEDDLLGTSIAAIRSLAVTFNAPVVNNPGTDILLFDFGTGDTFDLTINAQTSAITNSSFQEVIASASNNADQYRYQDSPGPVLNTLALWTSGTNVFSIYDNDLTSAISVREVDLSTFGVANGASITTLSITDNGEFDPAMFIGITIPEPATVVLAGLGLGALALLRRRRTAPR